MEKGSPTHQKLEKGFLDFEDIIGDCKNRTTTDSTIINPEEYKSIIELSVAAILIADKHGKIISWNNALEKLTGIKQSEVAGLPVWDIQYRLTPQEFKTPELLSQLEKRLMRIIDESVYWQRQVFEQKMTDINGSEMMVEMSTFVTSSPGGNLLVAGFRDISVQKLAEMALAKQNEALSKLNQFSIELSKLPLQDGMEAIITKRLREFTGAIGVLFSEYDPETRTLTPKHIELESSLLEKIVSLIDEHVRKIHATVSDYMYHELTRSTIRVCNSLSELTFWPVPHSVGVAVQALLNAEIFIEVAFLVDGKLFGTALLALSKHQPTPPVEILENFVSLAAASLRHKRAEEALWKNEETLRTITENAADLIMKLDEHGTILYTSRVLSGYQKENVIGKNFCDWTAPEYHPVMQQALQNVFGKALSETYQSRALGSNHEIRWFLSRLSPVIIGGEVKNAVLILTDITERKQAEEALRESEENYRLIAQSSIDVIFIIDRFGKQLFFNNSIERVLGHKVEEVIGRSFTEFLPTECIVDYLTQLENVFLEKQISNFVTQMYHKNGHLIDVEITIRLVKFKGEDVAQGSIRDISAKKQADEELRRSLERNNALLGANPDMMFVFDSNCKIVDFHSESRDKLWVKPEIFLGKHVNEILPPEVVSITLLKVESVLATGKADYSTYELPIGNELKYFESRYVPCGKEVLSIVRDITERKKAEESLNLAIESYLDVFNSVSEAIYVLDESGTFIDVNQGAEKMYQYSKQELIGQTPQSTAAPGRNDLDDILKKMNQVFETGMPVNFDFWAVRKNGEVFPKEVFVNKGKYFGKDVLIATARDITEKNQAEERIKSKNEELQRLNAEKDKFFSIIAHDLKSPFNAFLGFTQLMVQDLPSLELENIQEIAVLMRNSASNLYRLLENLLQWSRLQRGMIVLNPQQFQASPKISGSMQPVIEIASKKGVEIVFSIPEDLTIYADINMLESVVRNLASNAVKFTNKGGKVLISGRSVNDNLVEISIKDTGIGMNPEMLDKLFRIDEFTCRQGTDGEPSTGLGLILCKDFIDRHGGKIWAESTEGMGSTFYFTLPDKA
jgi:PAS domain S-box-containing protein